MAHWIFHVAGFAPKVQWKRNVGRKKRTIKEAVQIARQNGVEIPEDIEFIEAVPGELPGSLNVLLGGGEMVTALCQGVPVHPDGYVSWADHYNKQTGKIQVRIYPDILTSDEAIVATFTHEIFELSEFRDAFQGYERPWTMPAATGLVRSKIRLE